MWMNAVNEIGFSTIPSVLSSAEVAEFLASLDAAPLPRSRAGIRHALRHPAVAALASRPGLLNVARRVLGDAASPFRATLFDKSPTSNWLVVWHQDTALPLQERREVT